ncbi:RP165 family protein [Rickettsia prowazekii]|uniref:Uncharacterized protein n=1 Tax=Rickettsia prowazekii (strain Rp22) TaxID=449216 RepID=D5AW84_RICPP|nr:hypothetical protein [Rickettsia prowazekii]ADE29673.1 conserved hypothetical protein [Rickettsia prowazekii str. Rp22]AFE48985.1 hypothetical protein M9W_00790 [Rickettsia prowazekii str. Chernikova]AFE49830.1 hypothetical protein M9Y_00790 [Rickettsia prowazekii str. Katsinyian]AFE50674.1 hypothetical protein MA1_00790 [Rickettsia prowazekii str. BuV67-CWPP]AFE51515.1 hypothetical protein MA3_00800 [Rickettsia prowazekii str. Dachau]
MLEYIVFSITRLVRSGANTIVEFCTNTIDTISYTTHESIEEPNLKEKDIEDDLVVVSLIGN